MGFMDKITGMFKGHKNEVKAGIDKAADVIESKVPDEHDDKVEGAADKVKDIVDKLPD